MGPASSRPPELAAELVRLKSIDRRLVHPAVRAAKKEATSDIPIVMALAVNPVEPAG